MQVEESSELARFREEWRAEVRARASVNEEPKSPQPAESSHDSPTPPNAVELYRKATQAEEQGMLDEALALYRRAFRREPNVDRLFQREETARVKPTSSSTARDNLPPAPSITTEVDAITKQLQESNLQLSPGRTLELQAVLSAFPDELMFIAQDEQTTSPLQVLPLEVIVDILMKLAYRGDTNAIERFATVCRKARAITLDPHIWRYVP
jgi:F-box protein 9